MTQEESSSEISDNDKGWLLGIGVGIFLTVTGVIPGFLARFFPKVGIWLAESGIFASGSDLVVTILQIKGHAPIGLDLPRILLAILLGVLVIAAGIWYLITRRQRSA